MNACESLFAKVMDFVLWESFSHIMQRHSDNVGVRTLAYAEQFRAMAFAQPTWRESLRDIEASLPANMIKRYAMGFHSAVRHSTLADTNDSRDWRIWSDLIRRARRLYASESLSAKLNNTVYALEYSMIDLCLNLFDWAPFRSIKAAVKENGCIHTGRSEKQWQFGGTRSFKGEILGTNLRTSRRKNR